MVLYVNIYTRLCLGRGSPALQYMPHVVKQCHDYPEPKKRRFSAEGFCGHICEPSRDRYLRTSATGEYFRRNDSEQMNLLVIACLLLVVR